MVAPGSVCWAVMHSTCCQIGSSSWFKQKMDLAMHWGTYTYNRDIRDLVACGAACGVCTAFKAPVGGVMFAMEMSTRYNNKDAPCGGVSL